MKITTKEKDAIRFYQGDIRERDSKGNLIDKSNRSGFYGIEGAYRTMNCLMFDGIKNEEERIAEGNGKLEPVIFEEIEKVIEVYCDIYRAMCKYASGMTDVKKKMVYRTERGCSIEALKKGTTCSFMSTSQERIPGKFFRKKKELTILDILYPTNVPHIDFQEVLGDEYLFKNQKEVLFPPFLNIELEKIELSQEEKEYKDIDNKPPHAKYIVSIKEIKRRNQEIESKNAKSLGKERNVFASQVLQKLINKEKISNKEKEEYSTWKKDVRAVIWKEFKKIEEQYYEFRIMDVKQTLKEDIRNMLKTFDKKRREYKKRIHIYNGILVTMNTIPLASIALSFIDSIEVPMKIIAIISSAVSVLVSNLLKSEVYHMKMIQRTKTYLSLCELKRDIKYETVWDRKTEERYIEKYKEIMKEDTIMSLKNMEVQIKNLEGLFQNEIDGTLK